MHKKIAVINSGSSSLKFQLYDWPEQKLLAKALVERIGLESPALSLVYQGVKEDYPSSAQNHQEAVEELLSILLDKKIIADLSEIQGVGHRVAHGGAYFKEAVLITPQVEQLIEELADLAPLHNPINLLGIRVFRAYLPSAVQVAVFDTAFHQTIAESRSTYPLPYQYKEDYSLRRYGFHGISHQYISHYIREHYGSVERIICAHLGNGSSICALKDGQSQMTSMGFTPTAGLMMGTRCGDIDPMILPFLAKHAHLSIEQLEHVLNQESGLKGISGLSSDMRDLEIAANQGHARASLALDLFVNRIAEVIASYLPSLNGLDMLVFTAGIGEHSSLIRQRVCQELTFLGLTIDKEKNDQGTEVISSSDSRVKVLVVPTNEEKIIAQEVARILDELST